MDIRAILDQLDEIIYISDPKSYELLYLNRRGRTIWGNQGGCEVLRAFAGSGQAF